MAAPCRLREQLPPPKHPDDGLPTSEITSLSNHRVFLHHPGYPKNSSTLLILTALDPQKNENSNQIQYGLHYETARIACAIVANCRWDGFLSESNAPDATPLALAPDDLLFGRDYYFHVPARDANADPYPTVPSFEHFVFPHNNLPPTWNVPELKLPSRPRDSIHTRDKSCRITASVLGNEVAHLIPQKEDAWFAANQMTMYAARTEASPSNATNDTSNALLLRSDLHQAFDNRQLVLVPKWGAWAIHVLSGLPGEELAAVYHNVPPQALSGLAVEYLFARFAWTVLGQTTFVRAGVARRLVLVGEDGRSHTSDVSGKECRDGFLPALARSKSRSHSRSHSPKKRTRGDLVKGEWGDSSDSTDGDRDIGDFDWGTRGRASKRFSRASNSVSVSSSAASSFVICRDASKDDDVREAPSEDKKQPQLMAITTVTTTPATAATTKIATATEHLV
ncbi:HNH endonuclease domain-containing protein [Cordyceps javanica]|uniref:HNH endonuclease domain-containing protein n=1 Tax=Cordyceps javanica TaxID=43265 RepID=A0A545VJ39_9HYPO|nr:HNH endonuclease domain-containing protein [Cordyceps javanica]TQW01743.1 HNH endonuclease domain-containing protein [Cordyceps javanica]